MGLRINTNTTSLVAQHRLDATSKKQGVALERLASGLRINKGADDVVGLLKSESLRAQLRGVSVGLTNIGVAKNLLGVAEGSLSQLTSIAQSLREKMVQAADDTISGADRDNIDTAVTELTAEFSRLVTSSKFDGVSLLDGTFTNKNFQVGPDAGNTLGVSLTDTRSSAIGKIAVFTTGNAIGHVFNRATTATNLGLQSPTTVIINGTTINGSDLTSDGVSAQQSTASSVALATLINTKSGTTGVRATALANVQTLTVDNAGMTYAGAYLMINGVTALTNTTFNSTSVGQKIVDAVNDVAIDTGVTASMLDSTASKIVLTAADGRNIDFKFSSVSNVAAWTFAGSSTNIGSKSSYGILRGQIRLTSDETFTMAGTGVSHLQADGSAASRTISLSTSFTLSNISVGDSDEAETGIFIMDNVIRQLQQRRSEVGAKVNRMDAAEAELQVRQENLSESESRIRDADVASETANLTAAQILQQAGIQVLQRANAIPQVALALLQG